MRILYLFVLSVDVNPSVSINPFADKDEAPTFTARDRVRKRKESIEFKITN